MKSRIAFIVLILYIVLVMVEFSILRDAYANNGELFRAFFILGNVIILLLVSLFGLHVQYLRDDQSVLDIFRRKKSDE